MENKYLEKIAGFSLGGIVKNVAKFGRDVSGSRVSGLTSKLDVGPMTNEARNRITNKIGVATKSMNQARGTAMKVGGGIFAGGLATKALSSPSQPTYGQY